MATLHGVAVSALPRVLASALRPVPKVGHVFLCIADHYEPNSGNADLPVQRARVDRWVREYPTRFSQFQDYRGRSPQHTFFYPAEAYVAEHLDKLAQLCHGGHGAVEVHLHHDGDNAANLQSTLEEFVGRLDSHGLATRDPAGRITYGFIHGNWALNNSRADRRWCGVDDETSILLASGCYADFTMPSAPADCQTRTVNSIYYATGQPTQRNGHDVGTSARVGVLPPAGGLLMIQGPLVADWKQRKRLVLPSLENGDLHGGRPPTIERLKRWQQANVTVAGRPDWFFVKLHTHGAPEKNAEMLLGEPMQRFHAELAQHAIQNPGLRFYYVTAREMAELVHQAEAGALSPTFV